ncbi:MAG: hypothetical protein J6X89_08295 [Bacteroidales bacterium]|nr:hypothetical protein [Bacteroidales bacterium]
MYTLQKYQGIASRHTCPSCGQMHKFTLYVDEEGHKLADNVGRCDRESSCGYHYTPRQYFLDHPEARGGKSWQDELQAEVNRRVKAPLCTIPDDIVRRSVTHSHDSDLITFLRTFLDPVVIEGLVDEYRIGVSRNRATIFFQIDKDGRCRTGKIMKYDPETGHRIKDPNTPGRITWVHSLMKTSGQLPDDWQLTQCLFGEHLLKEYPGKPVALVESEKTAVICAGLMPRYLWLATGGKSQINDRLLVLKGRKTIAYPDIDGYDDWTHKLASYPDLKIKVSTLLQQEATPEDIAAHIDIADWLIRYKTHPAAATEKKHSTAFLKAAELFPPEHHANLEAFIDEFELELWGVKMIKGETSQR